MGCWSKHNIYNNISIAKAIIFLAVSILVLQFGGMITPVRGAGRAARAAETGGFQRVITLTNECTGRYMQVIRSRINALGKIRRSSRNPQAQLLLTSVGFGLVTIQSNQSKDYICFSSKGKLRTRAIRSKGDCVFKEVLNTANLLYSYQSIRNPHFKIGFRKKRGKKLKGDAWRHKSFLEKCYLFAKPSSVPSAVENDPHAPVVDWDSFNMGHSSSHSSHNPRQTHRRRHQTHATDENQKWAPKIDIESVEKT